MKGKQKTSSNNKEVGIEKRRTNTPVFLRHSKSEVAGGKKKRTNEEGKRGPSGGLPNGYPSRCSVMRADIAHDTCTTSLLGDFSWRNDNLVQWNLQHMVQASLGGSFRQLASEESRPVDDISPELNPGLLVAIWSDGETGTRNVC